MPFLTFILKNLARRPVRSILTGVGVAVAVGGVVSLLGVSGNFRDACRQVYDKRRVDLLVVRAGKTDTLTSTIPERVGQRLRELPASRPSPAELVDVVSFPEADLIGVLIQGWPPDSFLFEGLNIIDGRRLDDTDRKARHARHRAGPKPRQATGDTLEIENQKFHVVGVFESFNVYENGSAVLLLPELQTTDGSGRPGRDLPDDPGRRARQGGAAQAESATRSRPCATTGQIALPLGPAHARIRRGYRADPSDQRHGLAHLGHRAGHRRRRHAEHDDHVGLRADPRDRHPAGDRLAAVAGRADDPGRVGAAAEPWGPRSGRRARSCSSAGSARGRQSRFHRGPHVAPWVVARGS